MKIAAGFIFAAAIVMGHAYGNTEGISSHGLLSDQVGNVDSASLFKHTVDGNQLFIESIVPRADFSLPAGKGAKVLLFVDGKLHSSYQSPAFVVKGLDVGERDIYVKVIDGEKNVLAEERFSARIL